MTLFNSLSNGVGLVSVTLGSLLVGLPFVSSATAAPVAQLQNQQPATSQTITIPSTGASVQISQIRVASTPPAPQNPCPSIYYEAPYTQYVVVPQVCRPNLITQQLDQMGMLQTIRATNNANMPISGQPTTPYPSPNNP